MIELEPDFKTAEEVDPGDVIRWQPEFTSFAVDGEVVGTSREGDDVVLSVDVEGQRFRVVHDPYDGVEVVGWAG